MTAGERVSWDTREGETLSGTVEIVGNGSTRPGDPLLALRADDGSAHVARCSRVRAEGTTAEGMLW